MPLEEKFGMSRWDFFVMDYRVDHLPISVVLRERVISELRRCSAFLWSLRRLAYQQERVWFHSMHNAFLLAYPEVRDYLLQSQCPRSEALHSLKCLLTYFYHEVLDPAYNAMMAKLEKPNYRTSIDLSIDAVEEFVQYLKYGLFLLPWPKPKLQKPQLFIDHQDVRKKFYTEPLPTDLSHSCVLPPIDNDGEEGDLHTRVQYKYSPPSALAKSGRIAKNRTPHHISLQLIDILANADQIASAIVSKHFRGRTPSTQRTKTTNALLCRIVLRAGVVSMLSLNGESKKTRA